MAHTYLVTGGTGLLGNNVVRHLMACGQQVRVLVRQATTEALDDLAVQTTVGDVTDAPAVRRAMKGVDYVIHAAGDLHIGWTGIDRQRSVNVGGAENVARAAHEAGARMIHVSTVDTLPASSDGTPIDERASKLGIPKPACTYVVTKREAEQAVHQWIARGLDAVIVHPGFMLGPYDWKPSSGRMLLAVAQNWTPAAPTGGMSGCDARDVAAGILAAADRGSRGRHYILAGENITYLEAWRIFAQTAAARGPHFRTGPLVRLVAGRGGDFWGRLCGREPEVNSAMIRMSQLLHYYTSQRAVDELGYQVRPFRQSVDDAWQWLRQRGCP